MTGAPDVVEIRAVLNRAAEVGAHCRERIVLPVRQHDQERGMIAEPENLARVRLQVSDFSREHSITGELGRLRRNQKAKDRIKKRRKRCEDTRAQKDFYEATPRRLSRPVPRLVYQSSFAVTLVTVRKRIPTRPQEHGP